MWGVWCKGFPCLVMGELKQNVISSLKSLIVASLPLEYKVDLKDHHHLRGKFSYVHPSNCCIFHTDGCNYGVCPQKQMVIILAQFTVHISCVS